LKNYGKYLNAMKKNYILEFARQDLLCSLQEENMYTIEELANDRRYVLSL